MSLHRDPLDSRKPLVGNAGRSPLRPRTGSWLATQTPQCPGHARGRDERSLHYLSLYRSTRGFGPMIALFVDLLR